MQFIRNNNVRDFQTQQEQCSMLIFVATVVFESKALAGSFMV